MNKLEIVQMVNGLAGTQGQVDTVDITSGYQTLLVTFTDNAYKDIQTYRENWKFLQREAQTVINTVTDTYTNTDIASLRYILYNKKKLTEVPYDEWVQDTWGSPSGYPQYYTVNPYTGVITFNEVGASYTVDVYYHAVPDVMSSGTSEPVIPTRFQHVIVYKALIDLGGYLGNYDLIQMYSNKYNFELGEMMRNQIPATRVKTAPFFRSNWYV